MRLILYYRRLSIRNKVTLIISLFGLLLISFYTLYSYSSEKKLLNDSINEKLRMAAHSVNSLYGKEFHNRITNRNSITQEENIKNTDRLNILAQNLGVEYIYTVVMENDSVFFTSGNTNEEDIREKGYDPFYFHYPDAGEMLIQSFLNNKICFEEYTDSYGKFRSIYIPVKNSEGRTYVAGADISIDKIDDILNTVLIKAAGSGVAIFILFLGIISVAVKYITRPINRLAEESKEITLGKLDTPITVTSEGEIGLLSGSVKQMVESLKNHMQIMAGEKAGIQLKIEEAVNESEKQKDYLEKSVNDVLEKMNLFAGGNLSVKLIPICNDKIGELFNSFNSMVNEFSSIISDVKETIDTVAEKSAEISASTEQMTAGANEQVTMTSEIAQSVEAISKNIIGNASNASEAAANSRHAGEIAESGEIVAEDNYKSMSHVAEIINNSASMVKKLGESSLEIGSIIEVIEDIAEQTNMLALNAAIEAARAGSYGRGFAVVADEVKKLSDRTTRATKEISGMIKQIQLNTHIAVNSIIKGTEEVEEGKQLTLKAKESLCEIKKANIQVVKGISVVASSGEEQSKAIEIISSDIESITRVTNQNAVSVQRVARSSEDMNNLTNKLRSKINRFRVKPESVAV